MFAIFIFLLEKIATKKGREKEGIKIKAKIEKEEPNVWVNERRGEIN
jgi:hypothetical protein